MIHACTVGAQGDRLAAGGAELAAGHWFLPPPPAGACRLELAPEMGGREGIRARESTHLTLQTKGTQGIRMRCVPRAAEGVQA